MRGRTEFGRGAWYNHAMNINCQLAVDHSLFLESETHHLVIRFDVPDAPSKPKRPVAFCVVLYSKEQKEKEEEIDRHKENPSLSQPEATQ